MSRAYSTMRRGAIGVAFTVLVIGAIVIAWDAVRSFRPAVFTPMSNRSALPPDPGAITEVFNAPAVKALVPLAPRVTPTTLGNARPFVTREQ